jgi:hypothetical protein
MNGDRPPSAVYRAGFARPLAAVVSSVAVIALGGLLCSIPVLVSSWFTVVVATVYCGLLGLVVGLAGLMFFLDAMMDLGATVLVYPEGLARCRFGRTSFYRWSQVRAVWNNSSHAHHGGKDHRLFMACTVVFEDDRRFVFGRHFQALARLGQTIEEESCRALLPRVLAAYDAGETIEFGKLRLSVEGLHKGTVTQPWAEVTGISFDRDGWLAIGWKDREWKDWIGVSPNKVSNLHLLLNLLEEIRRRTGAAWQTPLCSRSRQGA